MLCENLSFQQALFLTYRWRVNLMRWLFLFLGQGGQTKGESEEKREMYTVKKCPDIQMSDTADVELWRKNIWITVSV